MKPKFDQNIPDSQSLTFNIIAIVGRPRNDALYLHKNVFDWLIARNYTVLLESKIGEMLNLGSNNLATLDEIGKRADLAIVIGGDGNMLSKARILSKYDIPVIGINRGNLGFLTDITPDNVYPQLEEYLIKKNFFVEERFLLESTVERDGQFIPFGNALNEIVIHPARMAHMIEFQVYINQQFAFSQRSDGLIISTPTGSTAYSLSAGGPILTPNLNAISLVPMFPHTLASRPLVIDGDSEISLRFLYGSKTPTRVFNLTCDSQTELKFLPTDKVIINKSKDKLKLLHLNDYNYFNVLGTKLGWLQKLF